MILIFMKSFSKKKKMILLKVLRYLNLKMLKINNFIENNYGKKNTEDNNKLVIYFSCQVPLRVFEKILKKRTKKKKFSYLTYQFNSFNLLNIGRLLFYFEISTMVVCFLNSQYAGKAFGLKWEIQYIQILKKLICIIIQMILNNQKKYFLQMSDEEGENIWESQKMEINVKCQL